MSNLKWLRPKRKSIIIGVISIIKCKAAKIIKSVTIIMFIIAAREAEVVNLSFVFEPIKWRTNRYKIWLIKPKLHRRWDQTVRVDGWLLILRSVIIPSQVFPRSCKSILASHISFSWPHLLRSLNVIKQGKLLAHEVVLYLHIFGAYILTFT